MGLELAGGAWAFAAAAVSSIVAFAVARVTAGPQRLSTEAEVEQKLWERVKAELAHQDAKIAQQDDEIRCLRAALEECTRGRAYVEAELAALRLSVLRLSERTEGGTHDG